MNETITLNISDAMSDKLYHSVKFQREWTVREAIHVILDALAIKDESTCEKVYALIHMASGKRLESDRILSEEVRDGDTLKFYEITTTDAPKSNKGPIRPIKSKKKTITLNIKDCFSDQIYYDVEFPGDLTVKEARDAIARELGHKPFDENNNERNYLLKRIEPETILQNHQILSKVVEGGETLEFYEEIPIHQKSISGSSLVTEDQNNSTKAKNNKTINLNIKDSLSDEIYKKK